jgi:hypothetical protein
VFLQNAWSPRYAGRSWPRRSWLKALARSRSGQRLRSLEGSFPTAGAAWVYENASPVIGATAASHMPADPAHMRDCFLRALPDVVVALGKVAGGGALIACHDCPLTVLAPHPASRVLTNALYERLGSDLSMLDMGFTARVGVVRYRQERGMVDTDPENWLVHNSTAKR